MERDYGNKQVRATDDLWSWDGLLDVFRTLVILISVWSNGKLLKN